MSNDRISALDGLRGVAIVMVMLHHYVRLLSQATPIYNRIITITESFHIGVDLFFIISGFLITGRLLATKDSPRYYRGFYWRRMLRIMPPYYLFLAVIILLPPVVVPPSEFGWHALFATNILIVFVGYLSPSLTILWSVALEEQFYMVWPSIVKRVTDHKILVLAIVMIVLQPILRLLFPFRMYTNPFTHLDGLFLGVLLCVGVPMYKDRLLQRTKGIGVAAALGIAYLGVRGLFVELRHVSSHPIPHAFDFTAVSLAFASIVLYVLVQPSNAFSRVFNGSFLQSFGKLSYSLYLFHMLWVAYWMMLFVPPSGVTGVTALAVVMTQLIGLGFLSWCFSYLLWKYFESPILSLKEKVSYRPSVAV